MNHHIPLRFVTVVLALGLSILIIGSPLSAKSNLSSARPIPTDIQKSITVAAYDTAYYYFQISTAYQKNSQQIGISMSRNRGLSLSVLDDTGQPISLTKKTNGYLMPRNIVAGNRYFLCIENISSEDITTSLKVFNDFHRTPVPSRGKMPTSSPKRKTHTASPKRTPYGRNKQKLPSSPACHTKRKGNVTPKPTQTPISIQEPKKITTDKRKSHFASKSPSPSVATNISPTAKPSRPAKHFIRMEKGSSMALAWQLFDNPPKETITIQTPSPDLEISDGIVYSQRAGLYYVLLNYGGYQTSCTIKVD